MRWICCLVAIATLSLVGFPVPVRGEDGKEEKQALVDQLKEAYSQLAKNHGIAQRAMDRMTNTIRMNRELIQSLQGEVARLRTELAAKGAADEPVRKAWEAERGRVSALLRAIGKPAVAAMIQALEKDPVGSAPFVCPAFERMGAVARPAVPTLRKVYEAQEGTTSTLAGRALASIPKDEGAPKDE